MRAAILSVLAAILTGAVMLIGAGVVLGGWVVGSVYIASWMGGRSNNMIGGATMDHWVPVFMAPAILGACYGLGKNRRQR